jgi:hypothetical protein
MKRLRDPLLLGAPGPGGSIAEPEAMRKSLDECIRWMEGTGKRLARPARNSAIAAPGLVAIRVTENQAAEGSRPPPTSG